MFASLQKHLLALNALIARDLMVRFGRRHLGFIWSILEPMILTAGVMVVWSQIHEPVMHGVPIAAFIMTGYMPLTLSRHFTNGLVGIFRNNSSLLYHIPISHVDIIVARAVLEFLTCTMASMVIYFIVVSIGLAPPAVDPTLLLVAWLFSAWHFGAVGVLTAIIVEYWEPLEKFVQPLQYLQLPISGVFFMVDWTPTFAQKLLLWNPPVSCYEMLRAGYFGEGIVTHYSVTYLASVTFAMTITAAILVAYLRPHIEIR